MHHHLLDSVVFGAIEIFNLFKERRRKQPQPMINTSFNNMPFISNITTGWRIIQLYVYISTKFHESKNVFAPSFIALIRRCRRTSFEEYSGSFK